MVIDKGFATQTLYQLPEEKALLSKAFSSGLSCRR
jgi:hypothetical protein